jgi:hypothetical protein
MANEPLLHPDDFDFRNARLVLSAAQKYVIPVAAEGEELRTSALPDKGIAFYNPLDDCIQVVRTDGTGVLLVNEVKREAAAAIREAILGIGAQLDGVLPHMVEPLIARIGIGLKLRDIYNSHDAYVRANLVPMDGSVLAHDVRPAGWMRKSAAVGAHAIFVKGPARFAGPTATPQLISEDGAFVVRSAEGCHVVNISTFLRTYVASSSEPLLLSDFVALPR